MVIEELNSEKIYECVFDENGLVILVFYTEEFEPSNKLLNEISDLYKVYENVIKIYKINYAIQKELINAFEVVSLPTLLIFKDGEEKHRFTGTVTNQQIEIFISMLN